MIKNPTQRIIQNDREFEKAALFRFKLQDSELKAIQGEDFKMDIDIEGSVLPNEAFIEIDQIQYRLKRKSIQVQLCIQQCTEGNSLSIGVWRCSFR